MTTESVPHPLPFYIAMCQGSGVSSGPLPLQPVHWILGKLSIKMLLTMGSLAIFCDPPI